MNHLAENNFFRTVADAVYRTNPIYFIGRFQFFVNAFAISQLLCQLIEHILCISVNIFKVLFQRAFHPHHVDDRREVTFQIVVVVLSPNADAGNKFIFYSKILLCKYIVPQRRKKKQKYAILYLFNSKSFKIRLRFF